MEPEALRQIKKPLRTKNIATEVSPIVYRPLVKGSKGSIPNPPKGKLWEKITRTARVSRRNPKALFFGSNAWAKFCFPGVIGKLVKRTHLTLAGTVLSPGWNAPSHAAHPIDFRLKS